MPDRLDQALEILGLTRDDLDPAVADALADSMNGDTDPADRLAAAADLLNREATGDPVSEAELQNLGLDRDTYRQVRNRLTEIRQVRRRRGDDAAAEYAAASADLLRQPPEPDEPDVTVDELVDTIPPL